MARRFVLAVFFLTAAVLPYAQDFDDPAPRGEPAAAARYAEWARNAINENRWAVAEEALERAADYSNVSSDLSYLLALTRLHQNRPKGAVLEALRRAGEANRWDRYTPRDGLLLEAETLIIIRLFDEALFCLGTAAGPAGKGSPLARTEEDLQSLCLRLKALMGLNEYRAFTTAMTAAMNRFPRASEPVRLLFQYAADRTPGSEDRELVNLALRRLPLLVEEDPDLAWLAAPFIRDTDEARRYIQAYRAAGGANPAALPAALNLGIIDEYAALNELFPAENASNLPARVIDLNLIETVHELFRDDNYRALLRQRLANFTGVITEDTDRDGWPEARARYQNGTLLEYSYDTDQDGLAELVIYFSATGAPLRAEVAAYPDSTNAGAAGGPARPFAYLINDNERSKIFLEWERYPVVLRAELDGVRYIPRPMEFFFSPIILMEPVRSSLLFPARDTLPRITRRTLISFAQTIERPGREIQHTREIVELNQGIPQRAWEYLEDNGTSGASGRFLVSETEFALGLPVIQRVDLNLDGRMETARRFPSPLVRQIHITEDPLEYSRVFNYSESDWDGDGIYEYSETHDGDFIIRSWDLDKDGVREYTETVTRDR
jgi:hypothetical protein